MRIGSLSRAASYDPHQLLREPHLRAPSGRDWSGELGAGRGVRHAAKAHPASSWSNLAGEHRAKHGEGRRLGSFQSSRVALLFFESSDALFMQQFSQYRMRFQIVDVSQLLEHFRSFAMFHRVYGSRLMPATRPGSRKSNLSPQLFVKIM